MKTKHKYTYVQCLQTSRGTQWILRRDDGKRVRVSRQRLNLLADEHRIVIAKKETEDALADYSNFMDQVITS